MQPHYTTFYLIQAVQGMSAEVILTAIRGVLTRTLHMRGYTTDPQDAPCYAAVTGPKRARKFRMLVSSAHPEREAALVVGWQGTDYQEENAVILGISTPGVERPRAWKTQVEYLMSLIRRGLPFKLHVEEVAPK